jgi:EXPERA (EXPanded EBP superfamily)
MASSAHIPPPQPFQLDIGTAVSLAIAFSLMPAAQVLASFALPKTTRTRYRVLFLWHAYDFLTHFIIEGSYLYHCFFSYIELPIPTSDYPHPASRGLEVVPQLYNRADRRYGAIYSQTATARMWQEYAKADRRWGGADLTVISLEILTVGLAGPAAAFVCYQISKLMKLSAGSAKARTMSRLWFAAIMLATGELYGGFVTFAPEWLSGSTQLDVSNPVYLWLYLVFFNVLWVFLPLYVLYAGYQELSTAFARSLDSGKKTK